MTGLQSTMVSPWSGGDDSSAEAVQATSTPLPGEAEAFDLLDAAPPQYQGMTKAQEDSYRDFASEVRRVDEAMDDDNIIVTAGVPFNVPGTTNILRVAPMDEQMIYESGNE